MAEDLNLPEKKGKVEYVNLEAYIGEASVTVIERHLEDPNNVMVRIEGDDVLIPESRVQYIIPRESNDDQEDYEQEPPTEITEEGIGELVEEFKKNFILAKRQFEYMPVITGGRNWEEFKDKFKDSLAIRLIDAMNIQISDDEKAWLAEEIKERFKKIEASEGLGESTVGGSADLKKEPEAKLRYKPGDTVWWVGHFYEVVGVISIDEKLGPTYRLRREGIQDQKVYEQELIEEQENTPKPEVILFKEPRSAVIVKSNQEIAVAGEVTKNGQRFVKPSKGEDIPKDEVEYLEDAKIHQGMEVTLVLKPGKDEPKYTVQEVYLDTSVPQYPYGVVLVGLKANDSSAEFQEMDVTYAHLSSSNKLIAPPEALAEWRREKSAESSEKSTTTQEPPKPKPKEGSQESPESSKTEFKFKHGDEVRVRNQDTGEWQIRKVNKSFVGNEDKVYVRYIDPSGKEPEKHIPEWLLERWNPRPASQTETEKDDKQQQGGNGPPDNKANKVKNNENPWLDPRFILQIKEKFEKALKKHADTRKRLNDETSEHFITVLRTGIIQEAVTDRISRDKWLAGTGPTGDSRQYGFEAMPRHNKDLSPEELEEVKSQIATMMDNLSYEELSKMAEKAEENAQKGILEFNLEDVVKYGGQEWKITDILAARDAAQGQRIVLQQPDGTAKIVTEKELRAEQGRSNIKKSPAEENLEKLKPYFNHGGKVKLPNGTVINGRVGYSTTKHKVYIARPEGKWKWIHAPGNKNEPYLVDVKEFLDWQNLKTTEEEMKPYAGKDVNYINSEGEALNGRAEYFKRKNKIRFITDSGEKLTLNADRYLAYHKWVDKKLEKIDREVPANERNFVLGQKVRIIRNGAIEEGWRVDDFEKSTNVYGKSDPKITLIKNGREWKVEQSTLENFKKAPDDYGTVTTPPVATATT
jgi:hypothetical protein